MPRLLKHIFPVIYFYFISVLAIAQYNPQPTFYRYTVNDGLPSSECYNIIQDKKGFMWVATDRGVARFDGYSFTNYTTEDGLAGNVAFTLFEDSIGKIWMVGSKISVSYYNNGIIKKWPYQAALQARLKGAQIPISFYADASENVWIGFEKEGIWSVTNKGIITKLSPEVNANALFLLKENPAVRGTFYNDLKTGSIRIVTEKKSDTLLNLKTIVPVEWGLFHRFFALNLNDSTLFTAAGTNYLWGNFKNRVTHDTLNAEILAVYKDRDGLIWLCTNNGVYYGRPGHLKIFFPGEIITSAFEDREGGFWFSTLRNGIIYVPGLKVLNYIVNLQPSVYPGAISMAQLPDTRVMILNNSEYYLFKNDSLSLLTQNKMKIEAAAFGHLFYDSTNNLFITPGKGITTESFWRQYTQAHLGQTLSTITGKDGKIWQGGPSGVFVFEKIGSRLKRTSIYLLDIRTESLYTDAAGNFYAGTIKGLFAWDKNNFTKVQPNEPLLQKRIFCIKKFGNNLLLGTIGDGLILYNKNEKPFQITTKDGLVSNVINDIAIEDNSNIWLATNKGLARVTFNGKDSFTIKNYTQQQGLPSIELRKIIYYQGKILIASSLGLTVFDIKNIHANALPPPVWIEHVIVNNEKAEKNGNENFAYNQNYFRFVFKGINYRSRGVIEYRYHLNKGPWQFTNQTNVDFPQLPAGSYEFEVAAKNEDGVWSNVPAVYQFTILTAWWQSWWFYLLVFVIISAAVFAFVYNRFRQIQKEKTMQMQLLENQQMAIAQQINPHFFFNTLNAIQAYILTEDKMSATRYLSKLSKLMRLSLDNSRLKVVPLAEEINLLHLYLEMEALRFSKKFESSIEVEAGIDTEKTLIPSMIIQPFLENAVRHGIVNLTERKGNIEVHFYMQNSLLYCTVDDNGIGRKAAEAFISTHKKEHRSAGMDISRSRLQLLSNELKQVFYFEIIDKYNDDGTPCGTKLIFVLPFKTGE